ncbi:integrase core domain-containing protein [Hyphomicrobiaceae bacterium 22]|uniref:Integrase core domain-containing protein n=1 Tax=Prosthecodimorpha staleyi TaxID=2840188 RepID=A0A947GJK1_9HYPH|nr:integrase core domain-containing protein [Prosthecodimorpha staleyi]
MIVSDNATEFISHTVLRFREAIRIEWHYIALGKNAFAESLNGRLRNECMNEHVFSSLGPRRDGSSKTSGSTTTPSAPIRASAASHRRSSPAGPIRAKSPPDQTYDRQENGEHVTGNQLLRYRHSLTSPSRR